MILVWQRCCGKIYKVEQHTDEYPADFCTVREVFPCTVQRMTGEKMVSKQKKAPASFVKLPETTAGIIEGNATMMIGVVGLCLCANAVTPTIA